MTEYIAAKFKQKFAMLIYNKGISRPNNSSSIKVCFKNIKKELIIEKVNIINEFIKNDPFKT